MEKIVPPSPGDPRRPLGPRDPGDAWVEGDRGKFWGRFGSAGLLVHDAERASCCSTAPPGATTAEPGDSRAARCIRARTP